MTDKNDLLAELDRLAAAALGQPPALGPVAERGDERTVGIYLDDARAAHAVDEMPKGETRLLGFKRSVMRVSQLFLHRQARYNASLLEAVSHLNDQVALLRNRVGAEFGRVSASMATIDAALDGLEQRLADLETNGNPDVLARLAEVTESHIALRSQINSLSADLERAVTDIRVTTPPAITTETAEHFTRRAQGRADAFYERFEDAMRGTIESVKARLEPYLTDLEQRRSIGGPIIDIGCGRGEWLELLRSSGFDALGVDTNEEAVARCVERGLNAIEGDAIAYLRGLEPASVLAVTGFHIIEHLPPDVQIDLIEAAARALKPGGVLILETPNPTNLNVGAASFYSDPSHLRPVDPGYLYFVYVDIGFVGVEVRYLNPREDYEPSVEGTSGVLDEMMNALRGPRDFSVVGRKPVDVTNSPQ